MGVPYADIQAAVMVRINALVNSTTPDTLEAAYIVRPLGAPTQTEGSTIFPPTAVQDAILNAEQKLAQTIAEVRDHPWRASLISRTGTLASGAIVPSVDENGVSVIGVYGAVFDETDGYSLVEQPSEVIERRLRTASLWKIPVYQYAIKGDSIVHTRMLVRIEVCVWDYVTRQAAVQANNVMLLADVLAEALVCGALAMLARDDEWMAQAQIYAGYFTETIAAIRGGTTNLPVKEAA